MNWGDLSPTVRPGVVWDEVMATQSSILAWEDPWTEELEDCSPWGCQSDTTEWLCMHAHTALSARAFRHEGFQESAGGAWCCLAPCHSEVVEVATGGTEPVCKHPWAHGSCGRAGGHHGGGRSPACSELQLFWSFLRWQILPLRYLSALKFFFPLSKLSSSFHLCPFIEVEFVIYLISFIYVWREKL